MTGPFLSAAFFTVVLTLGTYAIGAFIQKRIPLTLFNPLLISTILVIGFLSITGVSYKEYYANASWISALLGPTVVALAIPLNRQFHLLSQNKAAILVGILAGTTACLASILLMGLAVHLPHGLLLALLPKSITSAIGIDISAKIGGDPSITLAAIAFTGIGGAILARPLARLFRITEPIAHGLAIGASSHAMGTAKAIEISELTGAISSLAIVLAGLLTVILIPLMLPLLGG